MQTKMMKNKGFTLIELLLVIAIIGILAAAILVGISGQRERARTASALETVRSVLPYMVECYMRYNDVDAPDSATAGGDTICPNSNITWPAMPTGCQYSDLSDPYNNNGLLAYCGTNAAGKRLRCDYSGNGRCESY